MCQGAAATVICTGCGDMEYCRTCSDTVHGVKALSGHTVRGLGENNAPDTPTTPMTPITPITATSESDGELAERRERSRMHATLTAEVTHATARQKRSLRNILRNGATHHAKERARAAADREAVITAFTSIRSALDAKEASILRDLDTQYAGRDANLASLASQGSDLEHYYTTCEGALLEHTPHETLLRTQEGLLSASHSEAKMVSALSSLEASYAELDLKPIGLPVESVLSEVKGLTRGEVRGPGWVLLSDAKGGEEGGSPTKKLFAGRRTSGSPLRAGGGGGGGGVPAIAPVTGTHQHVVGCTAFGRQYSCYAASSPSTHSPVSATQGTPDARKRERTPSPLRQQRR